MRCLYIILYSAIFSVIVLAGCGPSDPGPDKIVPPDTVKDPLVDANKYLVKKENEQIEAYITRHNWPMTRTGTGLRYWIYSKGNGNKPAKGMTAQIRFVVNLINGNVVFDSKNDGMKSFRLGEAEVESGLEEGIMLMQAGDKARLVIPSHLALGLLGDDDKIPRRATLIYDVELVNVY